MTGKLECILLIDDDSDCNFFHTRMLNKMECAEKVHSARNGRAALDFLKNNEAQNQRQPEIIFLDINMPGMSGWDFLDEYKDINETQRGGIILYMVTSSLNPDDRTRAMGYTLVNGFQNKFMDRSSMERIFAKHFPREFHQ